MVPIQSQQDWKELARLLVLTFLEQVPIWKPGLAEKHLAKRIKRDQLPADCTLEQYNELVLYIVTSASHETYVYAKEIFEQQYVAFGEAGVMETAFPPDRYNTYLAQDRGYIYLGTVEEVMNDGC